jgi:hypothetical protein
VVVYFDLQTRAATGSLAGLGVCAQPLASPQSASVSTDASTYTTSGAITVSWTGLPGNAKDWIGLAPSGAGASTVNKWIYTGGSVADHTVFGGGSLAAGTYVARAFVNDTYTITAESAAFTVTVAPPAGVTTGGTSSLVIHRSPEAAQ